MRSLLSLVLLCALLAATSRASAPQIDLSVTGLVDASPGNSTVPVRLRLEPRPDASCSAALACSTYSAYALQVEPCPPGEDSCVGSFAIFFQNLPHTDFFDPLEFEMLPGVEYTVRGEWQVRRWSQGDSCDQLYCDQTVDFERSFFPTELVGTGRSSWSALKTRW